MKNIVTISLAIVVISVISILGMAVFFSPPEQATTKNISSLELAKHNLENDCWILISGKVYDITSYLPTHPSGPEKVILSCGKDGTTAFNDKGGKGPHSQEAQDVLNTFYVGNFE